MGACVASMAGGGYSKITASAGEHTQHCLWIMVLKQDKYQPKFGMVPLRFNVTPCTGGCLYPTYGVGTVFEGDPCGALTITEVIYPSKIVMKHQCGIVMTYTIVATPGGAEIGTNWEGGGANFTACLERQSASMKRVVEAEAQAILEDSPLPSEAAVRQLQPAAGTMITVPQGSSGGQQLTVQTASGPVTCIVPKGMVPGNQFMIPAQQPAPAPAPVQQAPIQQQPAPVQDQVVAMQQQPVPRAPDAPTPDSGFCQQCGAHKEGAFCGACGGS